MLIRITLAIRDAALRKQFHDVLARPDILLETPRTQKSLWERVVREPSDVLIIGQSLLPEPLKEALDALQKHPDSPATVVLSESADPKDHARLLAKGVDAVLFTCLAVEPCSKANWTSPPPKVSSCASAPVSTSRQGRRPGSFKPSIRIPAK